MLDEYAAEIDRRGFATAPGALAADVIATVLAALRQIERSAHSRRCGETYAIRNLMEVVPAVRAVAATAAVRSLVEPVLGPDGFPVQAIFFDKLATANWKVPWHQDLSIPVKTRLNLPDFGPWSLKAGVPHVQPPISVLERMLIVRLHLDDCTEQNGALRVIAGSHRYGRLSPTEIRSLRAAGEEITCEVPRGGALAMRPLLLHASSAARVPGHRRVIHLEYAAEALPDGLEWYTWGQSATEESSAAPPGLGIPPFPTSQA